MINAMTNHPSFTRSVCMADAVAAAEASDSVKSYEVNENTIEIVWVGNEEDGPTFHSAQSALTAIAETDAANA